MSALRDEILGLLAGNSEPMTSRELYELSDLAADVSQISKLLYNLCRDGRIEKTGRRYRLPTPAPVAVEIPTPPADPEVKTDREDGAGLQDAPDPARRAIESALDQAQAALDAYVISVCDPEILGPLQAMRDTARLALENYRRAS